MLRNIFRMKGMLLALAMALTVASPSFAHEGHKTTTMKEPAAVTLRQSLRDLWIDHIFWTRNVALMTKVGNQEGARVAEANVVANAHAIANAFVPLYGQPAAEKLFGLLAGHYGAVKQYMEASYAANQGGKDAAARAINANAEQLATFLSSANPNWPKATVLQLLVAHGGHHMAQIDDFARNDFSGEAQIWTAMKQHMYMIADALASGVVKQFPKKF